MNGNFEELVLKIELPVFGSLQAHDAKTAPSLGPPT
jgi:hypothetical protein